MEGKKAFNMILIFFKILFIIIDIFGLINSIWTIESIKTIFYIHFFFMCIIFFFHLILGNCEKCEKSIDSSQKLNCIILFFLAIFYIFNIIKFISLSINLSNYLKYRKNCPFTISDLDVNLHIERRCDLYNINKNSRYSYQYICSYNPSKDFDFKLKNTIKNDNIICMNAKTIMNKEIIKLFFNEYNNIYYCSRTNIPEDYTYAKHKDCNNKNKYKWMIIIYTFSCYQIIYSPCAICLTFLIFLNEVNRESMHQRHERLERHASHEIDESRQERRELRNINNHRNINNIRNIDNHRNINNIRNRENNRDNNIRNRENNRDNNNIRNRENNIIGNNIRIRENEIRRIRNNDIVNFLNGNNFIINKLNNDSTRENENINIKDNFLKQKTRNIIIENKKEFDIETNIKNFSLDKNNKKPNKISLDEINIDILNSENKIINNIQNNENNQ